MRALKTEINDYYAQNEQIKTSSFVLRSQLKWPLSDDINEL